jgi:hypothetical protein
LSGLAGERDAAIPAIEAELAARREADTSKAKAAAAAPLRRIAGTSLMQISRADLRARGR